MKLLLDTHLLLWAAGLPERLPPDVAAVIADPGNEVFFSVASLWEITIKMMLGRTDFRVDPGVLRRGLLENAYTELPVVGSHVMALLGLPALHKDPFDRLLVAQAIAEGISLWTADDMVACYPGPIRKI